MTISASWPCDCNTNQAPPGVQMRSLQLGPFLCLVAEVHCGLVLRSLYHTGGQVLSQEQQTEWLGTLQRGSGDACRQANLQSLLVHLALVQ